MTFKIGRVRSSLYADYFETAVSSPRDIEIQIDGLHMYEALRLGVSTLCVRLTYK
jgi:hypothetical protein